jgi:restriction endonuclease S subunit
MNRIKHKDLLMGWKKAELGDLLKTVSPPIKLNTIEYLNDGTFPIIDQGKREIVGYTNNDAAIFYDIPAVIFGDHTKEVKFIDFPFAVGADGVKILDSYEIEKTYLKFVLESAVKKLPDLGYSRHFSELKNIVITFPSKPEQKAIARVLRTIDATIHTTEQLISQKELRKKWLMQQLITGKLRLRSASGKRFEGEWRENKLEFFIQEYKQKPIELGAFEVLTSAKAGLMKQTEYYGDNRITNRAVADYNVIPPNYLTYRSRSDDGLFTFNKNNLGIIGLISGYYPVFSIKNGDINFILMYMNYYRKKLTKYAIGTSQLVLAMNALKEAKFHLPNEEEQTAIAQVLQTADKEISLLKLKAEKMKKKKKGLMQQLLTGKIRTN